MGKSKDLATGAAYQDQTESDTRYVNVTGDSMTGELLVRRARSNTAGDAALTIHPSDTTVSYGMRIDQNTNSLNFDQVNNNTTKMSIDSSGRVTTPNQPAFQARGNFGWIATANQSYAEIGNWNVNNTYSHNIGSHFNTTSGRFTCPVAGRYQFNLIIYVNNSNNSYHGGRIYVNGGHYADSMILYQNGDSAYPDNTMSASYILNLSANDYVSYYHRNDIYGYHSYFSGFLIG